MLIWAFKENRKVSLQDPYMKDLEYLIYYSSEITEIARELLQKANKPKRYTVSKFYKFGKFVHTINNSNDQFIY